MARASVVSATLTLGAHALLSGLICSTATARSLPDNLREASVPVLGVRHQAYLTGTAPTVVLISGSGAPGAYWFALQEKLLNHGIPTLSYDRPATGKSAPGRELPFLETEARQLHRLLQALGLSHPVVLVGHSRGGRIANAFAHLFPKRTRGLILVDSPPTFAPGGSPWLRAALWGLFRKHPSVIPRLWETPLPQWPDLIPRHLLPLVRGMLNDAGNPQQCEPRRKHARDLIGRYFPGHLQAMARRAYALERPLFCNLDAMEYLTFQGLGDQDRVRAEWLGNRPVRVVSRPSEALRQRPWLTLSSDARQRVVSGDSHHIPLVHPEPLARLIREVLIGSPANRHLR